MNRQERRLVHEEDYELAFSDFINVILNDMRKKAMPSTALFPLQLSLVFQMS